jgi:hypothetical protein
MITHTIPYLPGRNEDVKVECFSGKIDSGALDSKIQGVCFEELSGHTDLIVWIYSV